jgi:hypothetical protein
VSAQSRSRALVLDARAAIRHAGAGILECFASYLRQVNDLQHEQLWLAAGQSPRKHPIIRAQKARRLATLAPGRADSGDRP